MIWGRISSLVLLGLALVKTLLLRAFRARHDPVARFNRIYAADGVLSIRPEEAVIVNRAGSCIACGRCDRQQGQAVAASRVGYRGMMAFALSGSRSLTESRASAYTISEIEDAEFERAERLCPVDVPLLDLCRLVRGHARRLEERTT